MTFDDVTSTVTNEAVTVQATDGLYQEQARFWVGQKITVESNNNGAGVVNTDTTIVAITPVFVANSRETYTITCADTIATLVTIGHVLSDVAVFETALAGALTLSYTDIDVVLNTLPNSRPMAMLPLETWREEHFNIPANSENFSKAFDIEANCTAVALMVYDTDTLISEGGHIDSWRIDLDSFATTDRDIEVGTPLYYDRLTQFFNSMGYKLKTLSPLLFKTDAPTNAGTARSLLAITQVMPDDDERHQLQFHINATAGNAVPTRMVLYKRMSVPVKFN